jgi:hypothetical protein
MKQLFFIAFVIIPFLADSQSLPLADKEELVYQSLKHLYSIKRCKTIHVVSDSADIEIQQFIKLKFPAKKWHFYIQGHIPESLLEVDKKSIIVDFNIYYRPGQATSWMNIVYVYRSQSSPNSLFSMGMCGSDMTGSVLYDNCTGQWKYHTPEEFTERKKQQRESYL